MRCQTAYLTRGPMSRLVPFAFRAKPLRLNLFFRKAVASNRYFRQPDASIFTLRAILRYQKRNCLLFLRQSFASYGGKVLGKVTGLVGSSSSSGSSVVAA